MARYLGDAKVFTGCFEPCQPSWATLGLQEGDRRVPGSGSRGRRGSTARVTGLPVTDLPHLLPCAARYVYVVATSIKGGQISCVCAAAKLAVVTFPSACLLYNPLLPRKLRARKKSAPSLLLTPGLTEQLIPQHQVLKPSLQPRPDPPT